MICLKIFKTPVYIQLPVFFLAIALWFGTTWFNIFFFPFRGFWINTLVGLLLTVVLLLADFGHALAHIFTARIADAPMDEVRITLTKMPHTLYKNNAVTPKAHRMRALGGPLFNALYLFLSAVLLYFLPQGTIGKELATWCSVANIMMLIMSLTPFPIVDGGSILKWTLVDRGWSPSIAEATAKRVGWLAGISFFLIGIILVILRVWFLGGIFTAAGSIVLGIGFEIVQ